MTCEKAIAKVRIFLPKGAPEKLEAQSQQIPRTGQSSGQLINRPSVKQQQLCQYWPSFSKTENKAARSNDICFLG